MIPDEAVEAAARALDPQTMGSAGALSEKFKDATRAEARRALEAAAPFLMAQAWEEGLEHGAVGAYIHPEEYAQNPYRAS